MSITFQCFLKLLHVAPCCSYLKMSHRKLIRSSVYRSRACQLGASLMSQEPRCFSGGSHHQMSVWRVFSLGPCSHSREDSLELLPSWGTSDGCGILRTRWDKEDLTHQCAGFHLIPAFSSAPLPGFFTGAGIQV